MVNVQNTIRAIEIRALGVDALRRTLRTAPISSVIAQRSPAIPGPGREIPSRRCRRRPQGRSSFLSAAVAVGSPSIAYVVFPQTGCLCIHYFHLRRVISISAHVRHRRFAPGSAIGAAVRKDRSSRSTDLLASERPCLVARPHRNRRSHGVLQPHARTARIRTLPPARTDRFRKSDCSCVH